MESGPSGDLALPTKLSFWPCETFDSLTNRTGGTGTGGTGFANERARYDWSEQDAIPGRLKQGELLLMEDDHETAAAPSLAEQHPVTAGSGQQGVRPSAAPAPSAAAPLPANKDESGTDTDEDGALIAKAKQATAAKQAPKKRPAPGKARGGGGITLGLLIKEGIIWPGQDVLTVDYKNATTSATLTEDGLILCRMNGEDMTFESPSAFSIFLKRMVNPNRKADDGWKTVKFNGRFLEVYKLELARRRAAGEGGAGNDAEDTPSAKKARLEGSAGASAGAKPRASAAWPKIAAAGPQNGHSGPKRSQAMLPRKLGKNLEDPSQLIACRSYGAEPHLSGIPSSQSFQVLLSPTAALLMDFHAHLNTNEVVGLLGGDWDEDASVMRVRRAFPVQERQSEADSASVAMDLEDEHSVRELIRRKHRLQVVGWYHSHPHFSTNPSLSDIHTQVNQQHVHATDGAEPYAAAIISPNAPDAPGAHSQLAWFFVEQPSGNLPGPGQDALAAGCVPMRLQVEEVGDAASEALLTQLPQTEMRILTQRYASLSTRSEMLQEWQDGTTRLDKLMTSLAARLPASWPDKRVKEYLTRVDAVVAAAWNFYGPIAHHKAGEAPPPAKTADEEPEISDVTQSADGVAGADDEDATAEQRVTEPGPADSRDAISPNMEQGYVRSPSFTPQHGYGQYQNVYAEHMRSKWEVSEDDSHGSL